MSAGGDAANPDMPAMDGGATSWAWRLGEASAFPRHSVTQRDRSCAGRTTERGTEAGLTGCREAVIFNVARFRAPADPPWKRRGSGDVHGQATGRKGSRERGDVS